MANKKVSVTYVIATLIAVIFTWILHEFAHWLTSESFGHETIMRLNGTSPIDGKSVTDWQKILISASGPLITLIQALTIFVVLKPDNWNKTCIHFCSLPFICA